jgi:c-di-GMP-binding flagellar brake protein YcgR
VSQALGAGSARGQVPARVLDLSQGGALIAVQAALAVGAIHDLALDLEGDTVWVQAEIRHCREANRGPGYQVGVQFVGIDPHDQQKLVDYLARRG